METRKKSKTQNGLAASSRAAADWKGGGGREMVDIRFRSDLLAGGDLHTPQHNRIRVST